MVALAAREGQVRGFRGITERCLRSPAGRCIPWHLPRPLASRLTPLRTWRISMLGASRPRRLTLYPRPLEGGRHARQGLRTLSLLMPVVAVVRPGVGNAIYTLRLAPARSRSRQQAASTSPRSYSSAPAPPRQPPPLRQRRLQAPRGAEESPRRGWSAAGAGAGAAVAAALGEWPQGRCSFPLASPITARPLVSAQAPRCRGRSTRLPSRAAHSAQAAPGAAEAVPLQAASPWV